MQKDFVSKFITAGYEQINDRPKKWPAFMGGEADRSQYVTASEIGKCARMIRFGKEAPRVPGVAGFPNWGAAERGNVVEQWVVDMLTAGLPSGSQLEFAGADQVTFMLDKQSGTPDGLITLPNGDCYVLEIKSIDPRTNISRLPKDEHKLQCYQNMHLVYHLYKDIKGAALVYINASNFQATKEFYLPFDPTDGVYAYLEDRATIILGAATPNEVNAEGVLTDDGCKFCDYHSKCSAMIAAKHALQTEGMSAQNVIQAADSFFNNRK